MSRLVRVAVRGSQLVYVAPCPACRRIHAHGHAGEASGSIVDRVSHCPASAPGEGVRLLVVAERERVAA